MQFKRPKNALQPQVPLSRQQAWPRVAEQLGQLAVTQVPDAPPWFPPPVELPPLPFGIPPFPCPPGPVGPPSNATRAPSTKSNRGTSSDVAQAQSAASGVR